MTTAEGAPGGRAAAAPQLQPLPEGTMHTLSLILSASGCGGGAHVWLEPARTCLCGARSKRRWWQNALAYIAIPWPWWTTACGSGFWVVITLRDSATYRAWMFNGCIALLLACHSAIEFADASPASPSAARPTETTPGGAPRDGGGTA